MDLNFGLHETQLKIFNSPARFKAVAAGRRFGKSYLSCVMLLIEGLKSENEHGYDITNKEVWYIAPTFNQAKDIMWGLIKELGQDVISSTVENTGTVRLINGRKIQLKGSDRPDTLRGVGCSFVVLDEYAFMKPQVWEEIVQPTLADVLGKALFIGTPDGKNHFFELFTDNVDNDEWETFQFFSKDNPFLPPSEIESARNRMGSVSFRQEFEASFEAAGAGIFKSEWALYDDNEPSEGEYYIAVDPAGYSDEKELMKGKLKRLDETAIAIVKSGPYGWWVREIDCGRWNIRETSVRILKHAKEVRAMNIGIEKGALMNAIMPYMEDQRRRLGFYPMITGVSHGGQKKTQRITWALQGRFEHGRIKLNSGHWTKKFVDQLLDFPNPLVHDDMLDALAYIDQVAIPNYSHFTEGEDWQPLDPITGY